MSGDKDHKIGRVLETEAAYFYQSGETFNAVRFMWDGKGGCFAEVAVVKKGAQSAELQFERGNPEKSWQVFDKIGKIFEFTVLDGCRLEKRTLSARKLPGIDLPFIAVWENSGQGFESNSDEKSTKERMKLFSEPFVFPDDKKLDVEKFLEELLALEAQKQEALEKIKRLELWNKGWKDILNGDFTYVHNKNLIFQSGTELADGLNTVLNKHLRLIFRDKNDPEKVFVALETFRHNFTLDRLEKFDDIYMEVCKTLPDPPEWKKMSMPVEMRKKLKFDYLSSVLDLKLTKIRAQLKMFGLVGSPESVLMPPPSVPPHTPAQPAGPANGMGAPFPTNSSLSLNELSKIKETLLESLIKYRSHLDGFYIFYMNPDRKKKLDIIDSMIRTLKNGALVTQDGHQFPTKELMQAALFSFATTLSTHKNMLSEARHPWFDRFFGKTPHGKIFCQEMERILSPLVLKNTPAGPGV